MKRILITGANGFIGKMLTSSLAGENYLIRQGVRSPSLDATNRHIEQVPFELTDESGWGRQLDGVDVVVHLAAHVHIRGDHSSAIEFDKLNAEGTRRLAEQAASFGAQKFVFLSTAKVLGEKTITPFHPADRPDPSGPYARSKLQAERYLTAIATEKNLTCVIVRPPLVYGPAVRANFLKLMQLVQLGLPLPLRGIKNRRSMVNIWNLCSFLTRCIEAPTTGVMPLHVSDGHAVSTPDLIRLIGKAMGRQPRLFPASRELLLTLGRIVGREDEVLRLTDSLELAVEESFARLNWEPAVPLGTGIDRTVRWFLEHKQGGAS